MTPAATQIGAAAISGPVLWGIIGYLWKRLRRDPESDAKARKLGVEADGLLVDRLWTEIKRLDRELQAVRLELAEVRTTAADEKTSLETENKRLRFEVSSLRKRVSQLEEIITTKTTPEDMRAQLAEIDRKTAGK